MNPHLNIVFKMNWCHKDSGGPLRITIFCNVRHCELRLCCVLLLYSCTAKEPGALSESGGTSTAEPSEDQRSSRSAALQPLVQTLLRWLPAWVQSAEVSLPDQHISQHTARFHRFSYFILYYLFVHDNMQDVFFRKIFKPNFYHWIKIRSDYTKFDFKMIAFSD